MLGIRKRGYWFSCTILRFDRQYKHHKMKILDEKSFHKHSVTEYLLLKCAFFLFCLLIGKTNICEVFKFAFGLLDLGIHQDIFAGRPYPVAQTIFFS